MSYNDPMFYNIYEGLKQLFKSILIIAAYCEISDFLFGILQCCYAKLV